MLKIKKILFPVDFSNACVGASRHVEAFTGRFLSELTMLHVVDSTAFTAWGPAGAPGIDLSSQAMASARVRMDSFLIEEFKQFDVTREVRSGDPGSVIVGEARRSGADLIMMPTRGMSVFRQFILGSITAKVLHDAQCPVWTGAHLENSPLLEKIAFPKVLCAVDLGPESAKALSWAAGFADEHAAQLIVTFAVPPAQVGPSQYLDGKFVAEVSAKVRKDLRELIASLGIKARVVMGVGEPAKAMSEIAQSENAPLLVIGRGGAAASGFGRLRTHSYAIIRSAPCPVVSV